MGRGRVNPFWHDWMKTACSCMAVRKEDALAKANRRTSLAMNADEHGK